MKCTKTLFTVAMALTIVSCAKHDERSESETTALTVTASFAKDDGKTTLIDGGTEVYWEPGDKIKVFYGNGSGMLTATNEQPVTVSQFKGNVSLGGEAFAGDSTIWGVYPYSSDIEFTGDAIITRLQNDQVGKAGSFASRTNVSLAKSSGPEMFFYNACGGLRFSLTHEGVTDVIFEGLDKDNLAGKVKLAFEGGVPVMKEVSEASSSITLHAPDSGTFEVGKWYYFVALPGTLKKGFKMTFNTSIQCSELTLSKSVIFKRGVFASMSQIDKNLEYKDRKIPHEKRFDGTYYHDIPNPGWETEVMDRAKLLSDIQWVPRSSVPKAGKSGTNFTAGEAVSGIPYSTVSAEEGIVGIQTSFYTFLSSVHNPVSTLYTTDYRSGGDNLKATRYGCVCSSAVMYAWGCAFGYYTEQIYKEEVPFIVKKTDQTLEGLELTDALCYYSQELQGGHVFMVYDIARNEKDEIQNVSIFEASAPTAHITTYTLDKLKQRISGFAAPVKVFKADERLLAEMESLPDYIEQKEPVSQDFPAEICLEEGDMRTFAKGKSVCVNVLAGTYQNVQLFKDDSLYRTDAVADKIEYKNLPVGMYKARLSGSKGKVSGFTFFEVGDVNFNLSLNGTVLTITCPGNSSRPVYVTLNGGDKQLLKKSADNIWSIIVKEESTHCRVHFAGVYSGYSGLSKQFR